MRKYQLQQIQDTDVYREKGERGRSLEGLGHTVFYDSFRKVQTFQPEICSVKHLILTNMLNNRMKSKQLFQSHQTIFPDLHFVNSVGLRNKTKKEAINACLKGI